jgi:putative flippase GtrA
VSFYRSLYRRFQVVIHEIAKFGLVGAFNAVLDIALFNYLHFRAGVGPLTSKALSTTVAATSSYFMNRHWSFAHRARSGLRREYVLFIVLSAVGLAIVEVCLAVTRYGLGLKGVFALNVAANGVGLVLGTLWRFWAFKRWVFLPAEPGEPTAMEAAISTTA